jgi:glycosyltransferase involved in cell wall biosynthesis
MTTPAPVVPGLVSAIIPVYNRSEMLREAVDCVLRQTYRPIEIIIVDDGSTDDTGTVADSLAGAWPDAIRVIHQPNLGPGLAREAGRVLARGEFLQYLDSDDALSPRKLELQVAALRENADRDIAYCGTHETSVAGQSADCPARRTGEDIPELLPTVLSGRIWATVTPLYRRAVSDQAGPWSSLRQEEDWEYDARVGLLRCRLVRQPQCLATVRHHWSHRAGGDSLGDPAKMRGRAEAHRLIYQHARRYGVAPDDPHMQRFARELFLLARQCGAAGLRDEARELFDLARGASLPERRNGWDFRAYATLASVVGWVGAGRLACWTDRFRPAPR